MNHILLPSRITHAQPTTSSIRHTTLNMSNTFKILVAALPIVSAWPAVMDMVQGTNLPHEKRAPVYPTVPAPKFTTGRDNCGSHGKCTVFNEQDQFVDVRPGSGHEFQSPGPNDKRGQCPGLNAAANHDFLPRNGIPNIKQSMTYRSVLVL